MSAFEERGSQETTSSQDQGCSEGNNIKQAMCREETWKEAKKKTAQLRIK